MDPVYSVLPGNTLIPYDDVFLASYLFKVVSWWIFIRQECRTKKNRTMWLCWQIGLVFCLAIPVLCRISGDTRWWIISDAVTGILLLGSSLRTFFKTDTDVMMLHTGLWFLWTGSFLGDLAVSGYAPFTYRAFMFAGGTLFQLSIYSVDRRGFAGYRRRHWRQPILRQNWSMQRQSWRFTRSSRIFFTMR